MGEEKKNEARLLFLRRARDKDVFQRDASVCVCVCACIRNSFVIPHSNLCATLARSLSLSLSLSLDASTLAPSTLRPLNKYLYIYIYTTHGKCDDKLTYRMTRDVVSQLEFATIHDRLFECK